jgi:hypothetical protein
MRSSNTDIPFSSAKGPLAKFNIQTSLSIGENITRIDEEVKRLDALSRQIQQDRLTLLHHRNTLCPPINKLPVEVLCLIFFHLIYPRRILGRSLRQHSSDVTIPDEHPIRHPIITLTSVCDQWRQVACSDPVLWKIVILDVHDSPQEIQNSANLLNLYLECSSTLDFHLEINLIWSPRNHEYKYFGYNATGLYALERIISNEDNAKRFKTLCISNPPSDWIRSFSLSWAKNFTSLETFRYGRCRDSSNSYNDEAKLNLESMPALCNVVLKYISCPVQLPSTNTVSVLVLYAVPVGTCIELLRQCPTLVEYRCRNVAAGFPTEFLCPIPDKFTLPLLEAFVFSFCDDPWCSVLLARIRLPALLHLGFDRLLCDVDVPSQTVVDFCSRLPPSVTELDLRNTFFELKTIGRIFE